MTCLGAIGGYSLEADALLVRTIHEEMGRQSVTKQSARLLSYQLEQREVTALCSAGDWDRLAGRLEAAATALARAGAEAVLFSGSPLQCASRQLRLEIARWDPVALCLAGFKAERIRCVGLLGSQFPAEEKWWAEQLRTGGVETVLPCRVDRDTLSRILTEELDRGITREESGVTVIRMIKALQRQGAEVVLVLPAELSLLVHPADNSLPLREMMPRYVRTAVQWAHSREMQGI